MSKNHYATLKAKRIRIIIRCVAILIICAIITLWPNPINSQYIISDNEFRTIVTHWRTLQATEFFWTMAYSPNEIKGLWEIETSYLDQPYVDLSIVLENIDQIDCDTNPIKRTQKITGRKITVSQPSVAITFENYDSLFPILAYRNYIKELLYVIEHGIDSQWSLILPKMVQLEKSSSGIRIIISEASYVYWRENFSCLINPTTRICTTENEDVALIASIPDQSMIGLTRDQVTALYGNEYITLIGKRHFPAYITADGYFVIFIISDIQKTVDYILVFDLLNLDAGF